MKVLIYIIISGGLIVVLNILLKKNYKSIKTPVSYEDKYELYGGVNQQNKSLKKIYTRFIKMRIDNIEENNPQQDSVGKEDMNIQELNIKYNGLIKEIGDLHSRAKDCNKTGNTIKEHGDINTANQYYASQQRLEAELNTILNSLTQIDRELIMKYFNMG